MSGLYRELSTENGFEIRLVVIEGIDTTHNEVSCRLETLQFSQSLQYHALSYTWGDEKNPGSIICNGVRLSVTSNLASALHCLLKRGEKNNIPMSFWIDAICINQDDKSERENQVILMGDIYRQAAEVIVWLGPTADNSALAFDVCRRLCFKEHDKIATTSKEPQKKSWATDSESYTYIFLGGRRKLNKGLHDFIRELDAIQAILKRSWWSRIWIIQEVSLARRVTVFCGDDDIDWNTLDVGVTASRKLPLADIFLERSTIHHADVLFRARRLSAQSLGQEVQMQYGLCHLLSQFRWSRATNPRDKVYGLLGMVDNKSGKQTMRVSYTHGVQECYRDAMLGYIKTSGSLDVLQLCRKLPGLRDSTPSNFPSWLPSLEIDASNFDPGMQLHSMAPFGLQSSPGIEAELLSFPSLRSRVFQASNKSAEHNPRLQDNTTLIVHGIHLDTIKVSGEMMRGAEALRPSFLQEQFEHIRQLRNKSLTTGFKNVVKTATSGLKAWPQVVSNNGTENLLLMNWRRLALAQQSTVYPTGETLLQAFITTIHQGWLGHDSKSAITQYNTEWNRVESKVEALDQSFLMRPLSKESKIRHSIVGLADFSLTLVKGFGSSTRGYAEYLCFSVTELGYFALVPPETRKGDTVALLKGGPVPFIIRQKDAENDGEQQWELIGPCYVHGIMHGEQWDENSCKPINLV